MTTHKKIKGDGFMEEATQKQLDFLGDLFTKFGVPRAYLSQEKFNSLTKFEASLLIQSLRLIDEVRIEADEVVKRELAHSANLKEDKADTLKEREAEKVPLESDDGDAEYEYIVTHGGFHE